VYVEGVLPPVRFLPQQRRRFLLLANKIGANKNSTRPLCLVRPLGKVIPGIQRLLGKLLTAQAGNTPILRPYLPSG